jgi:DNA modification methylase
MVVNTILQGNNIETLKTIPDKSVNCCVTSPPYYGLRSYDENAVMINPELSTQEKEWLEEELKKRGIHER